MKKSLIALAVLAASGAAMAQSSVTLYGVADAGFTYVDGKDSWYGVTSGNQLTSRFGLRGTEDLGGGLKANFNLEAGVNLDTGDGRVSGQTDNGLAFKRRSTVGLEGGFGEVRLGRELTAAYNAVARYDVFGSEGLGGSLLWGDGGSVDTPTVAQSNLLVRTTNQRVSNAITYVSPSFSGFKIGANYGFGEVAGQNSNNRYMGLGATYDNGPLSLGLGLEQLSRDRSLVQGGDIKAWSLGGSYDFGVAKILAGYRQSKTDDFNNIAGADNKRKGYMLAVTAPVGPGLVKAAYNRYEDQQTNWHDVKADHFSIGYVYSLSKRTSLYGTYSYLKNKDDADRNRFRMVGAGSSTGALDNGKQQGLQVGVTHTF